MDALCPECAEHFGQVRRILDSAGLSYRLNDRLVRGLDYYQRTTFEVVSGEIGAQTAVAGGGRYDSLIRQLGDEAAAAAALDRGFRSQYGARPFTLRRERIDRAEGVEGIGEALRN